MRKILVLSIIIVVAAVSAFAAAPVADPIRVLILSGQNNHDWEKTTPAIKKILEDTGRFAVDVTEHPEKISAKQLEDYGLILSDWNTFGNSRKKATVKKWPKETQDAYLDFVRGGKGHVVVHAGGSSFGDWSQYQKLIGGASWKKGTNHGPRHAFPVRNAGETHPIAKGIGKFHTFDELWNNTGIDKDAVAIAEAYSSKEHRGSGLWEPIAAVNSFGKGRNFSLLLGHDAATMKNPGFRALLTRGAEWAATGKATIAISEEPPRTEEKAKALIAAP